MSWRDDLADTLTATGLAKISPYYRQTLKPAEGFVKWAGATQDTGFGRAQVTSVEVWIALSQDLAAAEKWIEANLPALLDAFATEVVVTGATPNELVYGTNSSNGIILAGTRGTQ